MNQPFQFLVCDAKQRNHSRGEKEREREREREPNMLYIQWLVWGYPKSASTVCSQCS